MKKVADMSLGELHDFVTTRAACTDAPPGVFTHQNNPDQPYLETSERCVQAAAICGRCAVRPGCLALGSRQTAFGLENKIFGGYYFTANTVVNVRTGTTSPRTNFFRE